LVREPGVPAHFRAWFEGGPEPLEFLTDGASPRVAHLYAAWRAEDPRARAEPLLEFLRRRGGWDLSDGDDGR